MSEVLIDIYTSEMLKTRFRQNLAEYTDDGCIYKDGVLFASGVVIDAESLDQAMVHFSNGFAVIEGIVSGCLSET
jgi:hypothetical protein